MLRAGVDEQAQIELSVEDFLRNEDAVENSLL